MNKIIGGVNGSRIETLFAMNNFPDTGIQRAIVWILNRWDVERYGTVGLCVHNTSGSFYKFLRKDIPIFELDRKITPIKKIAFFTRLFAYFPLLREINPKKVIAVNPGESMALCWVKRFNKNFRLIVSENFHVSSAMSAADSHPGWFGWYYRTFLSREYAKYADVVHVVSKEGAEDLIKNHGIPSGKIRVVYNPVNRDDLKKSSAEAVDEDWLADGNSTVVSASRISAQKRIDVLLRAWEIVKNHPEAKPYKLIICGDGPLLGRMKELSAKISVGDSVKFIGFQSNPWKFMSRARLFVSASEWEGLSLSLIEAEALGVPIVASDCPSGNKEILMNGEAGFLFENKNAEDCAQKILLAMENAELCRRKAKIGSENIERFELENIVRQYAEL